jgi:DNA invertase Pin-like site-specific DNA recombinase
MRKSGQLQVESGPSTNAAKTKPAVLLRAAQYLRRSTDNQRHSIEIQFDINRVFAHNHNMEIVRTYVDDGISGLTFERREALQGLIKDVQSGAADFTAILVLDVSRWGRFQDVDESAHFEFICRRVGIAVHYTAEPFENDGSFFGAVAKGLKRAMAAEYSRELSAKVFAGHCRLVELGFRQGAVPGHGMRRLLVDQTGRSKGFLKHGEYKHLSTDRVILVPGPPQEIHMVRWIFRLFVKRKKQEVEIARLLNKRDIRNVRGGPWTRQHVHRVLINENYIGNNVWNRVSYRLGTKITRNPQDNWVRADGAFSAIVDRSLFDAA